MNRTAAGYERIRSMSLAGRPQVEREAVGDASVDRIPPAPPAKDLPLLYNADAWPRRDARRWTIASRLVFILWLLLLFEPHSWLARHGLEFLSSVPPFLYLGLAFLVATRGREAVWYLPLLLFVLNGAVMVPFAETSGLAFDLVVKILLLFYILAIGSLTFIATIDKTVLVLHLFFWQFLWWTMHGAFSGAVSWHSVLGNEDAFGPLMVIGAGYCFYFGRAMRKRSLRLTAFFLSALCVTGIVSSFARGAFLAFGLVAAYMWFRTPQKARTAAALALGLVIVVIAADLLFPGGLFWQEMSTSTEGFNTWTGFDRWVLWKTAWRAFLERPISGVGAGNFGAFAGAHLWSDPDLMGVYRFPGRLWGRVPHSVYFQLLAEFGLIGVITFAALLIDFWKRNARLRSAPLATAWQVATHDQSSLRMLSLGLLAAMVAFLATGIFYDQLVVHWFYSLLAINALLHRNVERAASQQADIGAADGTEP